MTKKVLLVGCSNLEHRENSFKQIVFNGDANVVNLSSSGVGNQYIANNMIDYCEDNPVDYVFLQFSGLTRHDLMVADEYFIDYDYCFKKYKRKFLCSGGSHGTWMFHKTTKNIFITKKKVKI